MPFFCYIHRRSGGAPHFEVLPEASEPQARQMARRMLAEHADAERAELWLGEILIATVARETA